MWFNKEDKGKTKSSVAKTTKTQVVTETRETRIQTVRTRSASYSFSESPFIRHSELSLGNSYLALQPSTSPSTNRPNFGTTQTDARPININYQSPYQRQNPLYSSSRNYPSTQVGTSSGTVYRAALPSTIKSKPTGDSKPIKVKKTGKIYDDLGTIPTYKTHSKKRGEVLIINNIMFKEKGYRHGAKTDHKNLDTLFTQIGFNVKLVTDLKKAEMISKIKDFSKKNFNSVDIMVVVVMSHGTKSTTKGGTEIFGLDEKGVATDDLIEFFNDENCKSMKDKPKIFIFQCCRGDNEYYVESDAQRDPTRKIPVTDALIAYSCLPGFVSHRDPENGTWFISTMCDVFSEHAHEYHVEDLLKLVDVELNRIDKKIKQTTYYENRGFKRCYFHPK